MRYVAIGYPDEENIYNGSHTHKETWTFSANTMEEAEDKAFDHFYYFHNVAVHEDAEYDEVKKHYGH